MCHIQGLMWAGVLGIYPTSQTILPFVSAHTLRMRVTQTPDLQLFFFLLTHCEDFLWLWLVLGLWLVFVLVTSRFQIIIWVA